jgi:hypothetical protein
MTLITKCVGEFEVELETSLGFESGDKVDSIYEEKQR